MPKQDIQMSDPEIAGFLRSQTAAIVIAAAADGVPRGAAGRLHYHGGRVAFSLCEDDPVVALLAVDDRVCCIAEQFPSYYEIMGVMLHGHAVRRPNSEKGPNFEKGPDSGKDPATFDLQVEKVVSYDFGKLAGRPD